MAGYDEARAQSSNFYLSISRTVGDHKDPKDAEKGVA
jgi:hypothetical protein